ncbi:glycerol-3-phosphate 1-O-acyltransferase PlsY [Litchfieldia salsa]|uniref:Glycerol-3-phosphate acyltransferase n=1 Tax=Litchfieldia salsa TaxID=930152 RepID=A0A1H0SSC4_9BACI|nr:glycerol-3-phosphate 1-O-acyltransferase PlsY [Litchfieldia salsa]SDP44651.1 glycerol-3-phosphate acyltransferase PlsY [Litchfieldia salsa]
MILFDILLVIGAYLIGSIPSGLIVGKVGYGIDIRQHGSGNLGGTNTFRTLGKKAGIIVTLADILKGTLAAALPLIFGSEINPLLFGVIAVIGHMYPIFAGFKGGKAVATSGGVILLYQPLLFLSVLLIFLISLKLTKYVSLSSILTGIFALIYSIIYSVFFKTDIPLVIVISLLAFFVIYRHRANIKRIRNKTEPKITWL